MGDSLLDSKEKSLDPFCTLQHTYILRIRYKALSSRCQLKSSRKAKEALLRCATTAWVSELSKSEHVSIHLMALVDRVTPPAEPKRPVHIPVVQFSPASALVPGLCEGCKTE